MRSSYQLRNITARTTLPDGTVLNASQYGPAITGQFALGAYIEDYAFVAGSGDLDVHTGRFCVTPEYPLGTYAYFVTLNAQLAPAYPYVIGPTYYGTVQPGNTGPGSGHNTIPGNAVLYNPSTSVSELAQPGQALFPVPTSGMLFVQAKQPAVRSITLSDAGGRTVIVARGDVIRELDLAALPAGVYAARLDFADGSAGMQRVVKE